MINFKPPHRHSSYVLLSCVLWMAIIVSTVVISCCWLWHKKVIVANIRDEYVALEGRVREYDRLFEKKNCYMQQLTRHDQWNNFKKEHDVLYAQRLSFFDTVHHTLFHAPCLVRHCSIKSSAVTIGVSCPSLADAQRCFSSLQVLPFCHTYSLQSLTKTELSVECVMTGIIP